MKYFKLLLLAFLFVTDAIAKEPEFFTLSQAEKKLQQFVELKFEGKNVKLLNLKISREGSGKIFTIRQAIDAKIADKFFIQTAEFSEGAFSVKLKQSENNYILEVTGDIKRMVKIPVLSQNISKETVITQDILEFKKVSEESLRSTNITNIAELIGSMSSRNLIRDRAINYSDIKKPIIIKKNDIIQAIYSRKNMEVKILAVVQQDAAEGDVIRLKNYDSDRIFEGKINSKGQAIISPEEQNLEL